MGKPVIKCGNRNRRVAWDLLSAGLTLSLGQIQPFLICTTPAQRLGRCTNIVQMLCLLGYISPCKAKWQYLLTCKSISYCSLALHWSAAAYHWKMNIWPADDIYWPTILRWCPALTLKVDVKISDIVIIATMQVISACLFLPGVADNRIPLSLAKLRVHIYRKIQMINAAPWHYIAVQSKKAVDVYVYFASNISRYCLFRFAQQYRYSDP